MPPEDNDHADLERDLSKLPGIRAVRIVADRARIKEVHIVSDGSKGPKQLIRDIETLARATYDIEIDHRVISVTEFPDTDASATGTFLRTELDTLSVTTDRQTTTCAVTVRRGDVTGRGETTGVATATSLPRLIAEATLAAVSELTGAPIHVAITNCLIVPVGEHEVALAVLVTVDDDGADRIVPGVHPVRRDANDALARAVLDAVERCGA